jgi:cytochrome c-type biogenesis protein CcmH/NrfG
VRWPNDAKAFVLLGSAATADEKKDEARTAYEKALQLDPTLPDVKDKLLNP